MISKLIEMIVGSTEVAFLAGTILYGLCFSIEWLIAGRNESRGAESYHAPQALIQ